nr:CAP domain-containing protein [Caldalkalibacillus salinus]
MKKLGTLMCCLIACLALVGCNADNMAQNNRQSSDVEPLDRQLRQNGYVVRRNLQQQNLQQQNQSFANQNISSDHTSIASEQFPHTRAILVQPSKYIYVEVDPSQQHGDQQQSQQPGQAEQQPGGGQPHRPEQDHQQQPNYGQPDSQQPGAEQPNMGTPGQHGQPGEQQQQPEQEQAQQADEIVAQVVELTNAERERSGLSALEIDNELTNVAQEKSDDMQANNYFSHSSPTYGSPFDMMRDMGVSYQAAAENIAQGQPTAEAVVDAWMNSEGHRQNIMNGSFTHIGVGYNENGHYWTQMFITK